MRYLIVLATALLVLGSLSCTYRGAYYQPVPQRDATIQQQQEERVEELERTEKTETGEWRETLK